MFASAANVDAKLCLKPPHAIVAVAVFRKLPIKHSRLSLFSFMPPNVATKAIGYNTNIGCNWRLLQRRKERLNTEQRLLCPILHGNRIRKRNVFAFYIAWISDAKDSSQVIPYESLGGIRIYFPLKDILGRVPRKESILCFRDSGHGVNNFPVYSRERPYFLADKRSFLGVLTRT